MRQPIRFGAGRGCTRIAMIDDPTRRLFARLVRHDTTEENMKLLRSYLEKFGPPLASCTDKASIVRTGGSGRGTSREQTNTR